MEKRSLEYFVAIVDHGGFGRAADELRVSQPTVSHGIKILEHELKVRLFTRQGTGATLSAAGDAILPTVRQILRGFDTVRSVASSVLGLEGGTLDIASQATCSEYPLADLVGAMRIAHPDVRIRIHAPEKMTPQHVIALLRDGRAELALVGLDEDPGKHEDLISRELQPGAFMVLLPPGTEVDTTLPIPLAEVIRRGLIVGPWWDTSSLRTTIEANCDFDISEYLIVRTGYRESVIPLVAAGAGCAFTMLQEADGALTARGITLAATDPALTRRTFMVQRNDPLSPAAARFVRLALDHARSTDN